eukprot:Lithocolla_globosa_v1_NODE_1772_length_2347_cov_13.723822.p4 type:complete len:100 gc:universal NODE_1772_length_2347_cov_13.723822:342-641(+)
MASNKVNNGQNSIFPGSQKDFLSFFEKSLELSRTISLESFVGADVEVSFSSVKSTEGMGWISGIMIGVVVCSFRPFRNLRHNKCKLVWNEASGEKMSEH